MRRSVLALAVVALLGCAEADPAGGTGGGGSDGGGGAAGTVVASSGSGGAPAMGGSAGTSAAAGAAGGAVATAGHAGTLGSGGTTGHAGSGGGAGAAGAGEPPTCESIGWVFGSASLCGGSLSGFECASCGAPASPQPATFKNCVSATAAQNGKVICIDARTACGSCN